MSDYIEGFSIPLSWALTASSNLGTVMISSFIFSKFSLIELIALAFFYSLFIVLWLGGLDAL